ncbi:MAG: metallophosphoesterase family protein [Verrucomicrobia bacterium]|nr:metallophosphoesterase family protein [Verrucomicrobiota bacterium]
MKAVKAVFWAFLFSFALAIADEPMVVYLTWTKDPTTTMLIQWHTPAGASSGLSYHADKENEWKQAQGNSQTVQGTNIEVHRIQLEGLTEDREYVFKIQGSSIEYRFRTMPQKLTHPVRIAIGGDAFLGDGMAAFHRMNKVVAASHPDFVVIGGDLAYTTSGKHIVKGRKWALSRWQTFLKELQETLKSPEGRLVPILPVVGNHDITKPKYQTGAPEMFYEIFTFPETGKAYRSLNFGDYLSLLMLDTGHTWPIEGEQTAWLEKALKQSRGTYVFPVYHVAAYPSFYPYTDRIPEKVRKYWVSLFEKYDVPLAFEHHNHTFKRTYPIREGKVDPSGVIYLGGGSWGVPPRRPASPDQRWYLAKSKGINMVYIVTMTPDKCRVEAKNNKGFVFDVIEAQKPGFAH